MQIWAPQFLEFANMQIISAKKKTGRGGTIKRVPQSQKKKTTNGRNILPAVAVFGGKTTERIIWCYWFCLTITNTFSHPPMTQQQKLHLLLVSIRRHGYYSCLFCENAEVTVTMSLFVIGFFFLFQLSPCGMTQAGREGSRFHWQETNAHPFLGENERM